MPHHILQIPCGVIISYMILPREVKVVCQPGDSDTKHCPGQLVTEIENLRISITLPDAQNAPHLFVRSSLLLNSGLVTELRIRNKSINTPYVQ
jgi:hypothetical protein